MKNNEWSNDKKELIQKKLGFSDYQYLTTTLPSLIKPQTATPVSEKIIKLNKATQQENEKLPLPRFDFHNDCFLPFSRKQKINCHLFQYSYSNYAGIPI